jgi:hypothetical protein
MEEYNNFRFSSTPPPPAELRQGEDTLPATRIRERRTSSNANPLQFVKTDCSAFSAKAKETIVAMEKQKKQKEAVRTSDEDWQSVSNASISCRPSGPSSLFFCSSLFFF